MKFFLTGGAGFIGFALIERFSKDKNDVVALFRKKTTSLRRVRQVFSDLSNLTPDGGIKFLKDVDVVIHTAARVHFMKDEMADPLAEYRRVNVEGTINLARQAVLSGVKRFIFISSIKVYGEKTVDGNVFTVETPPLPVDDYGISKYEAEQGLKKIAAETNMEIVIIRPPLVYGPSAKGNFATMIDLVKKGYPLPMGSVVNNKRSLIALDNLVDFILHCADYKKTPQAANQTFVVSDGEDVSTAELFQKVAKAYGKKSRLFPFPVWLLRLGAKLTGKQAMADRLLGSLQVDSSKARELLGWKPVITMDEQLKKMAEEDALRQAQ